MQTEQNDISQSRREFLRGALVASVSMATIGLTLPSVAAVSEELEPTDKQSKQGYHLTPHIIDYYKSAS
jgi:hypothetical protein